MREGHERSPIHIGLKHDRGAFRDFANKGSGHEIVDVSWSRMSGAMSSDVGQTCGPPNGLIGDIDGR